MRAHCEVHVEWRLLAKVMPMRINQAGLSVLEAFEVKACFIAVVMSVSVAAAAHGQAVFDTTVESTPGLLGYWNFTAASTSNSAVNGYTGSFVGNAALAKRQAPPVTGTSSTSIALNLSGTPGGYLISDGSKPLAGGIGATGSVIAWFKMEALPSTENRYFSIAGESQVGNDFDLQLENDDRLYFYTDSGSAVVSPTAFTSADVGKWFFVSATFTANGVRTLYINGKAVATNTAGNHSANTASFYIGESPVFTGRYFDGYISDAAIFNTSLTAKQVKAIWTSRKTPVGVPPALQK